MFNAKARGRGLAPMKVFGIGLSRTGTTSLTTALDLLGFRAIHLPDDDATQAEIRAYIESGASTIELTVLRDHDALTDAPICCIYQGLDRSYPDSRFILTVREKESWIASVDRFVRTIMLPITEANPDASYVSYVNLISAVLFQDAFEQVGAPLSSFKDDPGSLGLYRQALSLAYDRYHSSVQDYFRTRPHQLLTLDVTRGEGWEKLAPFLNRPIPSQAFPHEMKLRVGDDAAALQPGEGAQVVGNGHAADAGHRARIAQVGAYLDAFRAHDLPACMTFFADDAVVRFLDKRFRGRREIEKWHRERFAAGVRLRDAKISDSAGSRVNVDIAGDSHVVLKWRATFRSRVVIDTVAGKFTDLGFEGFQLLR